MKRPRIAIVDDDKLFVASMRDLLTDEGYEILTHNSGDAAYKMIRKKQPNLVLLDMRLEHPEGGWMVLDLLRLDPQTANIPVIVCSADARFLRAKAEQLREEGCCVLEKPFAIDTLLSIIDDALDPATKGCIENTRA
jgi:CheY-like chemotaxis protein